MRYTYAKSGEIGHGRSASAYCGAAGVKCKVNGQYKTLKKLMPELGIPNWLRDSYPVIYQGEQVVAIVDLLICDGFAAELGWKMTLDWRS